jgi:hypothetical protein
MKIFFFNFLITLVSFYTVTAQPISGAIINDQPEQIESGPNIYPIPGSHLLQQEWQKTEPLLKAYMKAHANELAVHNLKKTSAWGFTVGQARTWWATNLKQGDPNYNKEYKTSSTCRAVGNNCYIFVEDSLWTNTTVTKPAVDSILTAFELRTPADPAKGIFQLDTMYFGNPPDIDKDPKIIILILDIKDNFSGSGGYVAGYFSAQNEYPESVVHQPGTSYHSNEAEIYYVDANPGNLRTSYGIADAASTTAHEFQHMIFWNYSDINNIDKLTFINEGLSESASKLCGYDLRNPSRYYANTNVDFLSWKLSSDVLPDYSRAALFSWYLIEQFGSPLTKSIVQNSFDAIACYDNAFQTSGSSLHFNDVIKNFALAAEINDKTFNPKYGFTVPISIKPTAVTYYSPNVSAVSDNVKPYGTRYVKFTGGQSLSVDVNSGGSLEVKAIATGTAGIQVDQVTLGTTYTLSDFGTGHSSIVLAITNLTNTATVFTYSASGTGGNVVELRYDYTEPVAASLGSMMDKDTLCVVFDALQNGTLDSIRVALRRNTQITGGVWKYTGVLNPSPLGQLLASNLTTAGLSIPPTPYPVPWPNWVTIDLRSLNISTNTRFAVGFRIDGTYPDNANVNRVMMTESPMPGEPTSLTYSTTPTPNWYIPSNATGDSVYTFLIRAYVSINSSGVKQSIELTPAAFVLEQNYPNPFNPSTIIRFQMPSKGWVTLKIYDIIGREVATLVNGFQETGTHDVKFDASNLPSGVYFYRIAIGKYTETKKLMLIK